MAITKTKFINYTKCKRFLGLENNIKSIINDEVTKEDYFKEEEQEDLKELLTRLDIDIIKPTKTTPLIDYYKQVEKEAGILCEKVFNGRCFYSYNTLNQQGFCCDINGIKYLCYVDIYNKQKDSLNIIEVKSTTSLKYKNIFYGKRGDIKFPLFVKQGDFYKISPCVSMNSDIKKEYQRCIDKLLDRFSDVGKYIYDLAVQRYIISHDKNVKGKINYYLAVLNSDYIYDGYKENGVNVYHNVDGEELICLFDFSDVTNMYQDIIDNERKQLEKQLENIHDKKCPVGVYCNLGKKDECVYKSICFKDVPLKNASYNYMDFKCFKDEDGNTYDKYDLINNGMYKLDDVPISFLKQENHLIQRKCYEENTTYIDKEKIKVFLDHLKYPIYHLDFESFPCPIPRFKGEKCYTQSCFEFSLHIERKPGVCDKIKDNYVFLAETLDDERENLVKELVKHVKSDGTLLAQNVSFEASRIKELSDIFPMYKDELLKIRDTAYDLLYIIKNNESLAKKYGFNEKYKTINYYHPSLSGSYSIKKTLPIFSNLKYSDLEIQNGNDALITYSLYDEMTKEEKEHAIKNLKIYCGQDTWAMVEILKGLRNLVK